MTTTAQTAKTTTWQIDPAHTQVEFVVKHMMFAKVRGRFSAVEGSIALGSDGDVGDANVSVTIDAASVDTGNGQRDEHLRSGDFFDVEQFPTLTFESREVKRVNDDTLAVHGDLTIRDVTKPVILDVTETGRGIDPWGNTRAGYQASTKIDRSDFGLTWNQALEAGGVLVGDEVTISLEVQAVEQTD